MRMCICMCVSGCVCWRVCGLMSKVALVRGCASNCVICQCDIERDCTLWSYVSVCMCVCVCVCEYVCVNVCI